MDRVTLGSAAACRVAEDAALYALGTLDAASTKSFAARLDSGCPLCTHEVAAMSASAAALAFSQPEVRPRPSLRSRLMARVEPRVSNGVYADASPEANARVLLEAEGKWKPVCPGVARKSLHYDAKANCATFLLRLDPGAMLPAHHHGGVEQCLVLDGEIEDGGLMLRKGDFQTLQGGTVHPVSRTRTGCTLLIVAEEPAATHFV